MLYGTFLPVALSHHECTAYIRLSWPAASRQRSVENNPVGGSQRRPVAVSLLRYFRGCRGSGGGREGMGGVVTAVTIESVSHRLAVRPATPRSLPSLFAHRMPHEARAHNVHQLNATLLVCWYLQHTQTVPCMYGYFSILKRQRKVQETEKRAHQL